MSARGRQTTPCSCTACIGLKRSGWMRPPNKRNAGRPSTSSCRRCGRRAPRRSSTTPRFSSKSGRSCCSTQIPWRRARHPMPFATTWPTTCRRRRNTPWVTTPRARAPGKKRTCAGSARGCPHRTRRWPGQWTPCAGGTCRPTPLSSAPRTSCATRWRTAWPSGRSMRSTSLLCGTQGSWQTQRCPCAPRTTRQRSTTCSGRAATPGSRSATTPACPPRTRSCTPWGLCGTGSRATGTCTSVRPLRSGRTTRARRPTRCRRGPRRPVPTPPWTSAAVTSTARPCAPTSCVRNHGTRRRPTGRRWASARTATRATSTRTAATETCVPALDSACRRACTSATSCKHRSTCSSSR